MSTNSELFSFGPYTLDAKTRFLTRDGERLRLGERQLDLLCLLVSRAGQVIAKDTLVEHAWGEVATTIGSLDQALYV